MHSLIFIGKLLFMLITLCGLVYGYWLLFWEEDWEWGIGSLVGDTIRTVLLLGWLTIAPHKAGRFFTEMGPISFLCGLFALIGGLGWLTVYSLSA